MMILATTSITSTLVLVTSLFLVVQSTGFLSLNGEWMVTNTTMSIGFPAQVPGSMYSALLNSGIIGEPTYRDNDVRYQWVGRKNWTFYTDFTVDADLLTYKKIVLVCEGLDTVSAIYINGVQVGSSVNMFVRYVFDIKHAIHLDANVIRVEFTSAVTYAATMAKRSAYKIPPECPLAINKGECHANMIRKMQCAFSWDWGPSIPTQGIWRDIYIQGYASAIIRDVTTETTKKKDRWLLKVEVFVEVNVSREVKYMIEVIFDRIQMIQTKAVQLSKDNNSAMFYIDIENDDVDTWWPRGYGNQITYPLTVTLNDETWEHQSSKTVMFGFRTVQLVQEPVSNRESDGKTFFFRVNGMPIFLKGSNWIPASSLPERATREVIMRALNSAVEANMNAIRVWGGGIYESDDFYEICDNLGILVWQDFMFACALYPVDSEFITSVREEITYQVRRMKHHPSMLAYSGNNENEGAIVGNWWSMGSTSQRARYKSDYVKLYVDTVYDVLKKEDPLIPFMVSSPSNGVQTEADGWISSRPSDTKFGDIHDYQYYSPFYKTTTYQVPRMASEYGLQSLPTLETLEGAMLPTDMTFTSAMMDHRQRHTSGNRQMMEEIKMYISEPDSKNETKKFIDVIYCTQIVQAIGMKTETEHYRRWQNRLNDWGQGNTMGALYWMLNDIWQAPTWSSLDYNGRWKMLHYFAARFFSPTLISPTVDGNNIDVYIVVDELSIEERRDPDTGHLRMFLSGITKEYSLSQLHSLSKISLEMLKDTLDKKESKETRGDNLANIHIIEDHEGQSGEILGDLRNDLYLRVYSWDSMSPLYSEAIPFQVETSSESVYRKDLRTLLISNAGCPSINHCFVFFHLGTSLLGNPDNSLTNWLLPVPLKDASGLQRASIQVVDVRETEDIRQFSVTITTDNIAVFVWLESRGIKGRFSDNGFIMVAATQTLIFYAWENIDVDSLKRSLHVKSLMDIYEV